MEVKALKDAITNLNYIRNLIETTDFGLSFQDRMEKFKYYLDRFEYDTSAIIGEVATNNILHCDQMRLYYKQLFRLVQEQRQYIKSLTDLPTYEMRVDGDVYIAVLRYQSYAEKFVYKISTLLPNDMDQETVEEIADNLYTLDDVSSKMLFLKYSGLMPSLEEDINNGIISKAQASRLLGYLLNTKPSNVQTLLSNWLHFNIKKVDNTPYKMQYVIRALKALDDAQVDASELRDIYSKLINQSK